MEDPEGSKIVLRYEASFKISSFGRSRFYMIFGRPKRQHKNAKFPNPRKSTRNRFLMHTRLLRGYFLPLFDIKHLDLEPFVAPFWLILGCFCHHFVLSFFLTDQCFAVSNEYLKKNYDKKYEKTQKWITS